MTKTPLSTQQMVRAATMLSRLRLANFTEQYVGMPDSKEEPENIWGPLEHVFLALYAYRGRNRLLTLREVNRLLPGKNVSTKRNWLVLAQRQGYLTLQTNPADGRSMLAVPTDKMVAKMEDELKAQALGWEAILAEGKDPV